MFGGGWEALPVRFLSDAVRLNSSRDLSLGGAPLT